MVQSEHAPCRNSVTKNDKVSNWSWEMYTITPCVEFEHIKGKDNVLADSMSRLRHLGLHGNNDPEEPGQECGKSIVDTDKTSYIVFIMIHG